MLDISAIVQYLGTNPWLGILSFFLAIISIILAIIFYIKSRKYKSFCYAKNSVNLIQDFISNVESLDISFSGKSIKNLTITKIAFWNAGTEIIEKRDIVEAEPITIQAKEGFQILKAKIIASKEESNCYSLISDGQSDNVKLDLDYIDRNDGVVIQVIHTGKSGEDIMICGRIKGCRDFKHIYLNPHGVINRFAGMAFIVVIGTPFYVLVFIFIEAIHLSLPIENKLFVSFLFGSFLFILAILISENTGRFNLTRNLDIIFNKIMGKEPEELYVVEEDINKSLSCDGR